MSGQSGQISRVITPDRLYISGERKSTSRVCRITDRSRSILGGSHKIVQELLAEARESWKKAKEQQISVYASTIRNEWRLITSRPKRPLKSIILDAGVKENILEDALNFLESKAWYLERGIPFRRGYLLVSRVSICACAHSKS